MAHFFFYQEIAVIKSEDLNIKFRIYFRFKNNVEKFIEKCF